MSIPIIPSNPPNAPITVPQNTSGVTTTFKPVDVFETSLASSLSAPAFDASNPRLSISDYYGNVSTARQGQKLQDILTALNDPLFRKALMKFVAEQSSYMAEVITLVYQYDNLQKLLDEYDLPGRANKINAKMNDYGGVSGDNAAIAELNSKTALYNTARTTYQGALTTYQSALNTYQGAQTTYQTALNTWQNALASYPGSISQAQLETARAVFNAAANQFENVDKAAFNNAQSIFDNAKAVWQSDSLTYTAAVNDYNDYVTSRDPALEELNDAIDEWNDKIAEAGQTINKMNAIRSQLGLSPLASTGAIPTFTGLALATVPSGLSGVGSAVLVDVNEDNALSASMNGTIAIINGHVTILNSGGYTPPLTDSATQGTIAIPTPDGSTQGNILGSISIPSSIVISTPETQDLINNYLLPRLAIIEALRQKTDQETQFTADQGDPIEPGVSGANIISAGAGGSDLGLTNATGITTSPFLGSILSKQAFQAFFNTFGVPAGSPLVDQIGALYTRIETNAGIASAGPANQILAGGVLTGDAGKAALNTAIALGNLSVVSEIGGSAELLDAIGALIENDPTLVGLTPQQKNGLREGIAGEIGASLNKSALNALALALGLPGLMPQVLALVAGVTTKDPLGSFSSQLFRSVVFAEELAKVLQIPVAEASDIIQASNTDEPAIQNEASVVQDLTNQIIKTGLVRVEVEQKVIQASIATDNRIRFEQQKSEILKAAAFKDSLVKSLALLEFDPAKADLLSAQIPVGTIKETTDLLIAKGLTLEDATQVATAAVKAANAKDPIQNPLSSFLVQRLGTTTEMAGLLKEQIINILSPAAGMRTAQHVAENYGSLIFSNANSITGILQVNERRLDAISEAIHDIRLNEAYREATISYRSPELADDSPLKLGKTLLLSGIPGGLSNQGLLSSDNTLGPSANQSKHATTIPGIFG